MKTLVGLLVVCVLFTTTQTFGQRLHDRTWGKYIGAYNCEVKGALAAQGCDSLHLWHIQYGYYGSTIIAGKNVAVAIPPNSPTQLGQWRGTLYVDATATDKQAAALIALFQRELAVYFGASGLQVSLAPVSFKVDQGVYTLQIGESGEKNIATTSLAANAFAWWSTPRADAAPVQVKKLDHASPVRTGEAPDVIATPKLQIGHTLSTSDKASGTATLCNFEYRGESYPDRGAK